MAASTPAQTEQQRLLAEHKDVVKAEALLMRRAIDKGDLKLVLNHAKLLLEELRTGSLTPKVRRDGRVLLLPPPPLMPPPPAAALL